MDMSSLASNSKLYVERRAALVAAVKQQNSGARGALVLLGALSRIGAVFDRKAIFTI